LLSQNKFIKSYNSVYLVRAWLTPNAHPYFTPLCFVKHQIYADTLGEIHFLSSIHTMIARKTLFILFIFGILSILATFVLTGYRLISPSKPRPITEPITKPTTEPKYDSESWRTLIPETCDYFFDGCNTCQRTEVGLKCTLKACSEYGEPKCLE